MKFALIDRLSQPMLSAYIFAKYQQNVKFCSHCGGELTFSNISRTYLKCEACNKEVYPTNSPCVIFTVFAEEHLLVGKRYSNIFTAFSGFIDIAETAE